MISEKVMTWFEREFGYSLEDAFEVQSRRPEDRTDYSDLINSRVPILGRIPQNPNIDYESSQRIARLVRPIVLSRRE